eukprot:UN03048
MKLAVSIIITLLLVIHAKATRLLQAIYPVTLCAPHCASYTPDGCNTCSCPNDGTPSLCTEMACRNWLPRAPGPECSTCSAGYSLNVVTKECIPRLTCVNVICDEYTMCDDTSTGPVCVDIEPEPKAKVGCGIDHCNSIYDGCHWCSCDGFK